MLLRRRWLALTAAIVLVVAGCVRLGFWQLHRHQDRSAANALVSDNYERPPVPAADLLDVGSPAGRSSTWRAVRATGTYDPAGATLVRNRTREGKAGVDVVVPLVTTDGPVLLVNRGYLPRTGAATDEVDLPPHPSGEVTVVGHIVPPQGDGSTRLTRGRQLSVPRLDVAAIAAATGRPTYGSAVNLVEEQPAAAAAPAPPEPPGTDFGPNLAYAVQWWMFSVLAIVGWVVFLRRDLRDERNESGGAPSQAPAGEEQTWSA